MSLMGSLYHIVSKLFSPGKHPMVYQAACGFQNQLFAALKLPWRCPG